ncbi:MAG TPA: PP0621 family protein [Pseudomonas sp.]|nr:PP0621 family protein [Pseudomonas sp.]
MARLLTLIALFALVWWLWRKLTRPAANRRPPAAPAAEPMVRCAHCGTHVPRREALAHDNRWYCSRAHLEQDDSPEQR